MSRKLFVLTLIISLVGLSNAQTLRTPNEQSGNTQTTTYAECIAFYKELAKAHPEAKLLAYGAGAQHELGTDAGLPLHLMVLDAHREFDAAKARKRGKAILLINNNIHPGEPEGADASMLLARDLMQQPEMKKLLATAVVCIVPMYNVDGALNRSSLAQGWFSRANQNGPPALGFRGNARNLDLNRDFIKLDSRNAWTLTEIFTAWDPDIFMDNHTTDGADYPAVMTILESHLSKVSPALAAFQKNVFTPALYAGMQTANVPTSPYVDFDVLPDSGLTAFFESPRYSSGYATLFHTLAYVPEAHMLKPFAARVDATYKLMVTALQTLHQHGTTLQSARQESRSAFEKQMHVPIRWKPNRAVVDSLLFHGFTARYMNSAVTGQPRLQYDRAAPYTKRVPYRTQYDAEVEVQKPLAYIVLPQWREVVQRLQANGANIRQLTRDTTLRVEAYRIGTYTTTQRPYEGHYLHSNTTVTTDTLTLTCPAGSWLVRPTGRAARYVVETLEPQAHDSYFNWNFFDSVLMQKEYFSDYLFEETAADLLRKDEQLREAFEARKASDPAFAKSAAAQLDYLYRRSPYMEPGFMRYPILRVLW